MVKYKKNSRVTEEIINTEDVIEVMCFKESAEVGCALRNKD